MGNPMPTYRISYTVAGKDGRRELIWTAQPSEADMSALARWIMRKEFPGKLYRVDIGMQEVLKNHGILDVQSPVPIYWPTIVRKDE